MQPVAVAAYTLTCAVGRGINALRDALASQRSGLTAGRWAGSDIDTYLGRVTGLEAAVPEIDPAYNSRNNRLAFYGLGGDGFDAAVAATVARFGADRCGVITGTSTSSIGRTEAAYAALEDGEFAEQYRQPDVHNPHATSAFVARELGLTGPVMTISTACSSSAKVFASAARWLECGLSDAVVVGGVDSLCLSVIHGFHSLQLVSAQACRPFDVARDGINLGEAAGFALLVRDPDATPRARLLGYGESSDAYHMSSAHPDGLGAELAMNAAIARSGLSYDDIGYLNLHGTGTRTNDDIEARVCARLFPSTVAASSTKGWTGHTLGAAGITEAIVAMDALETGLLPGNLNAGDPEPAIAAQLLLGNREARVAMTMTNSFGFGGNNCSLIFGKAEA
jgi:3-oxoacyl-[acyl-carrier-protein] synthase-1